MDLNNKFVDCVIEELDEFQDEYVYDLEMEDSTQPWFYANEILVHNSTYVSIKPLISNNIIQFNDNEFIHQETYDKVQDIESYLNKNINEWAKKTLRSKDTRFVFKRESICDVALFLQKKRYVMHVLDEEGIKTNKFKYTGVEVVRTTMPNAIKPYAKKIIETMLMSQSLKDTNDVVEETYEIFKNLPPEDIAFVMGVKGYEKYATKCREFTIEKRTPIHVKAAYLHNLINKKLSINNKHEDILSGDKVRYLYVEKPNKYGIDVIGFKYNFPNEYKELFKIDYNKMFEKILFAAIDRFYNCVNWQIRKPTEQVTTELFDLFAL